VEVELVTQTRAATGVDLDAQSQVETTFLLEEAPDLGRGHVGEDHGAFRLRLGGCGEAVGLTVMLDRHQYSLPEIGLVGMPSATRCRPVAFPSSHSGGEIVASPSGRATGSRVPARPRRGTTCRCPAPPAGRWPPAS